MKYDSPFDIKAEGKKIKKAAKEISNPKERELFLKKENAALKAHSDMIGKMSEFVNQKSSNGAYKNPG